MNKIRRSVLIFILVVLAVWFLFSPRTKLVEYPVRVTLWTKWFGEDRFHESFTKRQCPLPSNIPTWAHPDDDQIWCSFSHDRDLVPKSSALMFHARDTSTTDLPPRLPGQRWILFTQESPLNDYLMSPDKLINNPEKLNLFDYLATYRFDSDIVYPTTYDSAAAILEIIERRFDDFHTRKSFTADGGSTVLWLASNCQAVNNRHEFVEELSKHIPIDSLGNCMRTGPFPEGETTASIMRQYKFYLALENSHCEDYVSEKLWNALGGGAIPIVAGPPGIDGSGYVKFEPLPGSYIHVEKYKDLAELAQLLRRIDSDEALWKTYHRFRETRHYSREFAAIWKSPNSYWGLCGVCRKAVSDHYNDVLYVKAHQRLPKTQKSQLQVDTSCLPIGQMPARLGR